MKRFLVVSLMLGAACAEASHVFEGRFFVQHRACLGTAASIDVVEGESGGRCAPTCLAQPLGDGGRAIYVSNMCAPYPYGFDASGADPLCPTALEALARNDTCLVDGGSTHPAPAPPDTGVDGSARFDCKDTWPELHARRSTP
jgi:hypothetical protein